MTCSFYCCKNLGYVVHFVNLFSGLSFSICQEQGSEKGREEENKVVSYTVFNHWRGGKVQASILGILVSLASQSLQFSYNK